MVWCWLTKGNFCSQVKANDSQCCVFPTNIVFFFCQPNTNSCACQQCMNQFSCVFIENGDHKEKSDCLCCCDRLQIFQLSPKGQHCSSKGTFCFVIVVSSLGHHFGIFVSQFQLQPLPFFVDFCENNLTPHMVFQLFDLFGVRNIKNGQNVVSADVHAVKNQLQRNT